ncbi:MAG: hypothetical protein KGI54_06715 [Pseudomonadota bacterium]|nr:hypothetical protein [Pseudomonadota bacterium]
MGLLSKLLGRGNSRKGVRAGVPPSATFSFSDRFVNIPGYDMFGQFDHSPNRRFFLVWRDSYGSSSDGVTETIQGRYMLFDGERAVCDLRMARPNDGKVSDTGVFILNDWGGRSDLSGTFYAFRPDGPEILHQDYQANLYNNGLARDGNVLTIFDLQAGKEYSRWRAESGWPEGYEFSEDGSRVSLTVRGIGKFAYSLDGAFLDRQAWFDAGIASGQMQIIASLLRETGDVPNADKLRKAIGGIDAALANPRNSDSRTQAYALRLKAECYDKLGALTEALANYDAALSKDSKIGAKRRAAQIRKVLSKES